MSIRSILVPFVLLGLSVGCATGAGSGDPVPFETLDVRNTATTLPGVYTAGQPTEDQFAALPTTDVARVVCLRMPDEPGTGWEEERAAELGVDFVRIPVAGADGMTRANAEALDQAVEGAGGPVLVYCGSSNRVGGLLALRAGWLQGLEPDAALEVGRSCGLTRLEPTVREQLGRD